MDFGKRMTAKARARRALRPRHNENDPVFDKIRQIHAFIPQIHAFFRQIQDPSERGKNIKSLKIKRFGNKRAPGEVVSRGRGVCAHLPAFAPPPAPPEARASPGALSAGIVDISLSLP